MLIYISFQVTSIIILIIILIINNNSKYNFINKKIDYLDHKINNLEKIVSISANKIENNIYNINKDLLKKNIKLIRIESIIDTIKFTIQNMISSSYKRRYNHNIIKESKNDKLNENKNNE
ncbi:MAG: hypothetical protein IR527_00245 [Bacteroides sp.]|nr:MAG: hypothetical protein IR527_00245 [Bacteroides sp.]